MKVNAPWWLAVAIASGIALFAWRTRSLRTSGALAAIVVGSLALRVGWNWGAYLISWFAIASMLSRIGRERKRVRTDSIVAKSDQRDFKQVFANGGVFALCAAAWLIGIGDREPLAIAAAASLAAAGADTWATEIGTLFGGTPWSLRAHARVPVGTSGSITWSGCAALLAGAIALAGFAVLFSVVSSSTFCAVTLGALAGAWSDTLLGAWFQERRYCPQCQEATERSIHACGTASVCTGGIEYLDNDAVNLLCTLIGAGVALLLS